MIKRLTILLGLCLALFPLNDLWSQAGDYSFAVSSSTFTPITGGTDLNAIEADGVISSAIPIGFSFNFDGASFTTVKVSSDGFISFNSSATNTLTNDLDNTTGSRRPLVAPLWDDLDGKAANSASKASYVVTGTAPNRVFTMEWLNWEWNWLSTDSVVSFQVKLYETTDVVQFTYRWEDATALSNPSASIGLTGVGSFLSVTGINSGTPTASNSTEDNLIDSVVTDQVFTFTPPACPSPVFTSVTNIRIDSATVGFTSSGTGPFYINYGLAGFTQGATGSEYDTVMSSPFILHGLLDDMDYEFYIQSDCGVNGTSLWQGPFSFTTLPSCPLPVFTSFTDIKTDSLTINWSSGGSTGPWYIYWDATGFGNPPAAANVDTSTTTSFTAYGLTAGTSYSFYIKEDCGSGDTSRSIGPFSSKTAFTPPYLEDWTNGYPGSDYSERAGLIGNPTIFSSTTSSGWQQDGFANVGTTGAARVNIFSTNTDEWLIGPHIDLGDGTTPYQMELDVAITDFTGTGSDAMGPDDTVKVVISTDNGQTWSNANTLVNFSAADNIPNGSGLHYVINLSGYTGLVQFGFYAESTVSNTDYNFYVDNIEVVEVPACPDPLFLSSTVYGLDSVMLNWSGTAGTYNVEYGIPPFTAGSGTNVTVNDTFLVLQGLIAGAPYDFFVQSDCGSSGLSSRVQGSFRTTCAPLVAPFVETFDGNSWGLGTSGGANDSIDPCWYRNAESGYKWSVFNGTTASTGTGPDMDHTSGTGNFLYTESSSTSPSQAILMSPYIDVSALTVPYVKFWYHRFGTTATMGDMTVEVNDGSGWTTLITLTGTDQTSGTDPFKEKGVDVSSFGDTIQVRFVATSKGCCAGDMAIDDFQVSEAPSCPDVVGLNVLGTTDTSATLSWVNSSNATSYQVWYGPQGFFQGTSTTAGSKAFTTTNSYLLDTLTASSCYEFLVRGICGPTDTSGWVGPFTFNTTAGILSLPLHEDFENGLTYLRNNCDNVTNWLTQTNIVKNGSSAGRLTYQVSDNSSLELAGMLDLSSATNPTLIFWHIAALEGGFDDGYVEISTDGGNTYAALPASSYRSSAASYRTDLLFDEDDYPIWGTATAPAQNSWWQREIFDLSSFRQDSVKIRFRLTSDGSIQRDGWYLDDVEIVDISCASPTDLGTTNAVGPDSAQIYWVPGSASDFNVEYGITGFTRGTGTMINATNDSVILSGLTPATCYEYYVRDSCGVGDVSVWSGPYLFCTPCVPVSAPYYDDFNSNGWTADNAGSAVNSVIGTCWNRTPDNGNDYSWRVRSTTTASTSTGPDQDFFGNGNFVYAEASSGSAGNVAELLSPEIDLSTTTAPILTYAYHFYGVDIDTMYVDIFNGTSWNLGVDSVIGQHQTSGSDPWIMDTTSLSSYASGSVKVRFRAISGGCCSGDLAIDEFYVGDPLTCLRPTALASSGATTNSVSLSWTSGGASNWNIEYGPIGFTPGTGTVVTNVSNPYTLSGLTAGTCYEYYVQDSCGSSSVSFWAGPMAFNTLKNPLTFPLTEDFENGFTYFDNNCQNMTLWNIQQTIVNQGQNAAKIAYQAADVSALELKGPLDLTNTTAPVLMFAHIAALEGGFDEGHVEISTDGGATYTDLPASAYMGTAAGYASNLYFEEDDYPIWGTATAPAQNSWWKQEMFDLSAYKTTNVMIRFRVDTDGSIQRDGWYLDDVQVREMPCPSPTNVAVTVSGCDSVEVTWSSNSGSTSSHLVYVLSGLNPSAGTAVTHVSSPYTLSGLSLNTAYDVYLVDSCGATDISLPTGPITFKTDSVGPVLASFTGIQSATTYTDATIDLDASASTGDGLTYDWDFDNGSTGSGMNTSAVYTANGSYNVELTVTDRCGNTDDTTMTIIVGGISIIENDYNVGIDVYPNPSNGNFKLRISGSNTTYAIEVTDLSGKVVHRRAHLRGEQDHEIDLGDVASGVYLIRISRNGLNASQRIMVD